MESLLESLMVTLAKGPRAKRYWVAFSGGVDSTVLLHLMAQLGDKLGSAVLTVHVNHGLHANADQWAQHCASVAHSLGVEHYAASVELDLDQGESVENQARLARYEVFSGCLQPGDVLLTAHHREDQQETLLMRLFRGAGTRGLAGIPKQRALGLGVLYRPFLDVSGQELRSYAQENDLHHIEDSGNQDTRFDRNFIRHHLLPTIQERWSLAGLTRAAAHAQDTSDLLDELATQDFSQVSYGSMLSVACLHKLSPGRQANVLRFWIRNQGFDLPSAARLEAVFTDVIGAGTDASPCVSWSDVELRRYRDQLVLCRCHGEAPRPSTWRSLEEPLDLGSQGLLRAVFDQPAGLDPVRIQTPLRIGFRRGGERLKAYPGTQRRELKKLFQERGVFPWMRDRVPLIYSGDELVAVGDLCFSTDFAASPGEPGVRLRWERHPPVHST